MGITDVREGDSHNGPGDQAEKPLFLGHQWLPGHHLDKSALEEAGDIAVGI